MAGSDGGSRPGQGLSVLEGERGWRRVASLGDALLAAGLLTPEQLVEAARRQQETSQHLARVILEMEVEPRREVAAAVAAHLGVEFATLSDRPPDAQLLALVPEHLARRYQAVPLEVAGGTLRLGMVDPLDVVALDDLRKVTGLDTVPVLITPEDFRLALGRYPALDRAVGDVLEEVRRDEPEGEAAVGHLRAVAEEAPIVRLAHSILVQAVRQRASDIHVEPQEREVVVRFRVDGTLHKVMAVPMQAHAALVSRLKIMANLDIAERRVPQDGRIEMALDGRAVDLRVSTVPSMWGESVVMRILDKGNAMVPIERLGFRPEARARFERLIAKPCGLILVTGPTGSGKTTTLYAALNRLNRPDVKILTIEDPVEYQLPGIVQVQVNPRAGLTFARGLRAFLRQDPDIIMLGEVRDEETARIAVQASLTGHLVLSTLHTNDAPSAVTRLADMGIEPFLVGASVLGVVAQRLVRALCVECREPYAPTPEVLARLGLEPAEAPVVYRPRGCPRCGGLGYRGRLGLYEVMTVDDALRDLIVRGAGAAALREAALAAGMRTLREEGLARALDGTTSLEEVLRVVLVD
ncbi:MAG: type II secretion system ATPase GspE [Armatimonadota bacterium]|nr:type II secretion system ATPase GspE [Armatimonadota bacterium]MDR7450196.1 type II secretion system ATPase GspE [Armatimonadota bacterium]MDR7458463.1 type II secretion system ATPase GspE [Armatimonadota bacterium]MDR7478735.1 type II secretion system ATPase GspE [Armatimonadota bacterium]MDR7487937.1 type II secretion system ATPase GspE [Armatimonadota bacterium]